MKNIDHLDVNSGRLLEAYIQNKTTPSSLNRILEKAQDSILGSLLLGPNIDGKQLCQVCPLLFEALFFERRNDMTNIQITGEIAYFCSVLGIEDEKVCLGLMEPNVVSSFLLLNKCEFVFTMGIISGYICLHNR